MDSSSYAGLILDWYSKPADYSRPYGSGTRNAFGIRDLHGKVWEWTSDFNSMGPIAGDGGEGLFCGGTGGALGDRADYAAFMRYSFRSSLKPAYSVSSLGFRCAK
jgi:formylglycine-generating enzyme required for sulfatase activity